MLMVMAALGAQSLLAFSIQQWKHTPEMRIEDAYKWLFHATLGGEHAVRDDSGPRRWLDREWPTVGKPFPMEPEIVPLRPDGKIIRINLRPYKARGGDQEMLLAVFVASARGFKADKRDFVREWDGLGARLQKGPIGKIGLSDWKRLDAITRPEHFPAIDHSSEYENSYKPAYRVILRELWTQ